MKLSEIKLDEGLVDAAILMTIASIVENGISNGAQTVALARCFMAIQDGYIGMANNFAAYYNTFFPTKDMLDSIKALSKGEAQKFATMVYQVLHAKDEQVASYMQSMSAITDMMYYATAASANE
jgi:hypothetical protein